MIYDHCVCCLTSNNVEESLERLNLFNDNIERYRLEGNFFSLYCLDYLLTDTNDRQDCDSNLVSIDWTGKGLISIYNSRTSES